MKVDLSPIGTGILVTTAIVLWIFSLYSIIKTDHKLPYINARKKSILKGFPFMILSFLFFMIFLGVEKPNDLETLISCFIGGIFIITMGFGLSYLQIALLGKSKTIGNIVDSFKSKNNLK
jgi:hypothetical protein